MKTRIKGIDKIEVTEIMIVSVEPTLVDLNNRQCSRRKCQIFEKKVTRKIVSRCSVFIQKFEKYPLDFELDL